MKQLAEFAAFDLFAFGMTSSQKWNLENVLGILPENVILPRPLRSCLLAQSLNTLLPAPFHIHDL